MLIDPSRGTPVMVERGQKALGAPMAMQALPPPDRPTSVVIQVS